MKLKSFRPRQIEGHLLPIAAKEGHVAFLVNNELLQMDQTTFITFFEVVDDVVKEDEPVIATTGKPKAPPPVYPDDPAMPMILFGHISRSFLMGEQHKKILVTIWDKGPMITREIAKAVGIEQLKVSGYLRVLRDRGYIEQPSHNHPWQITKMGETKIEHLTNANLI